MSTALADIQKEIQKQVALQKENVPPSGGKISPKGKVFTLPDGQVITGTLSAVILGYSFQNVYFTGQWDGQSKDRPDCVASGPNQTTLKPNLDVDSPIAESCEGCPMNQWGSASNGRGGKACQNKVRLALATPDSDAKGPIYTLDLTPTALSSFQAFMDNANRAEKLPVNYVTEFSFAENSPYPTIRLKAVGGNDKLANHWAMTERAKNVL